MNAIVKSAPIQFAWKRIDNLLHTVGFILVIIYWTGKFLFELSRGIPMVASYLWTDHREFVVVLTIIIALITWLF